VDKAGLQRLLFDFVNIGNNRRNNKIQKNKFWEYKNFGKRNKK